jgi:hypothetical protein
MLCIISAILQEMGETSRLTNKKLFTTFRSRLARHFFGRFTGQQYGGLARHVSSGD